MGDYIGVIKGDCMVVESIWMVGSQELFAVLTPI